MRGAAPNGTGAPGLSQEAVAHFCGLRKHAAVNNWENGRNFPSLENLVPAAGLCRASIDWLVWGNEMASNIEARIRRIPKVLRDGLIQRMHDEIDKTEEAAKRLPKEMGGDVVKDDDERLQGWSAANLREKPRKKPRKTGRHKQQVTQGDPHD
jgi:transcriptional regulator with XRE-family HTH domain